MHRGGRQRPQRPSRRPPTTTHERNCRNPRDVQRRTNMSQSMSNNGGRGLLPTRSNGKEKDREGDDRLLRPTTRRDSPRARWGSNSTGQLSRKSSQAEEIELAGMSRLRRKSTATMADLQRERELRRQGEEYVQYPSSPCVYVMYVKHNCTDSGTLDISDRPSSPSAPSLPKSPAVSITHTTICWRR